VKRIRATAQDRNEGENAPAAAGTLLLILESLPPWERFPDDVSQWTPSQFRERCTPMPGHIRVESEYAGGWFEHECPAQDLEYLVAEWERVTGRKRSPGQIRIAEQNGRRVIEDVQRVEPFIERNRCDERRELVQGVIESISLLLPDACGAVLAAGGRPEPLRELERDGELHSDTLAAALVELRRLRLTPERDELGVTLQQLAEETGVCYATLQSRRQRGGMKPGPIGKDSNRRNLFKRTDWAPIVNEIRENRGGTPGA
jgi:hypothetical protein